MTPEAEAVLHFEIEQVLRHFGVGADTEATAAARTTKGFRCATMLYSVRDRRVSPSRKLSEPGPHLQAQSDCFRLQAEAIITLIKEHAPDVRAAD